MKYFQCLICNKEYDSIRGLTTHIFKSHSLRKEEYFLKYINNIKPKCEHCNINETKFGTIETGYKKYCSASCATTVNAISQWKDNDSRRSLHSKLATDRNFNGTFSVGRPIGSKNINEYPKGVASKRLPENHNELMSIRFTKMNLERTPEYWDELFKNRKIVTNSSQDDKVYCKHDFDSLMEIFNITSWEYIPSENDIELDFYV